MEKHWYNPLTWLSEEKTESEAEIEQPLREAVGVTVDADDADWKPLSGNAKRDLTPMTQRRMQDLAVYLWESNPLANRIIELPIAYLLAEGVKLKCTDDDQQKIIDAFWDHPINQMDMKMPKKVRELSLFGEQCYPAFVNEHNGSVRLGYLDPSLIATVVKDPDNSEQPIGIVTTKDKKGIARRYQVIVNGAEDELFTQRTAAIRESFSDGQAFYFCINDLSSGNRGRSDLLAQVDFIDNYEEFLFGEADRVRFMRAYMWDVELANATPEEVKERAQQITPPAPGSVRIHNDSEKWTAVTPDIKSNDTSESARLFRNHILGGATIPEHWFGGGGDVNRSTGESMGEPTFKVMAMRQRFLGHMLTEIGRFVMRQKVLTGSESAGEPRLNDSEFSLEIQFPEMIAADTTKYAAALTQVVTAAGVAVDRKLISEERAVQLIESISGRLGVQFDAAEELEAARGSRSYGEDDNDDIEDLPDGVKDDA